MYASPPRVTHITVSGPYTLTLSFIDGSEQRIDFAPMLEGEMFGPLRDRKLFDGVAIDQVTGGIVWPNKATINPWTLHDWHHVGGEFVATMHKLVKSEQRSRKWNNQFVVIAALMVLFNLAHVEGWLGDPPASTSTLWMSVGMFAAALATVAQSRSHSAAWILLLVAMGSIVTGLFVFQRAQ